MKEWRRELSTLIKTNSSADIAANSSLASKTGSSSASSKGSTSATIVGDSSRFINISKTISTKTRIPSSVLKQSILLNPFAEGIIIGVVSTGLYGVSNLIKYAKKKKSGGRAFKDTLKSSSGLGVSSGLGIAAAKVCAGTTLVLGSTIVVPLACGVTVTFIAKKIWGKLFFKKDKEEIKR